MTPLQMLLDAGYTVEFANPAGNVPVMDIRSDNSSYFGDIDGASDEERAAARAEYAELRALCSELGVCGAAGEVRGTQPARELAEVVAGIESGESDYAGVMVPGGHAPMQDLIVDPDYGTLLRHYAGRKPIGLICHAPVSLIAALPDPQSFIAAFEADDIAAMETQRADWPFAGAEIAVFTTAEEQVAEGGQLGGEVRFYPDAILEAAGATVTRAPEWQSNSIVSGLLVTGQNPGTHTDFGNALLELLESM
jgi:putative intracellular protease/amidase